MGTREELILSSQAGWGPYGHFGVRTETSKGHFNEQKPMSLRINSPFESP
jgi:hypothetical protein